MRSYSRRLLVIVTCLFVVMCLVLYTSLETRTFEQKKIYQSKKLELDKLEREIRLLEEEVKNNGRMMNGMLQKVREERVGLLKKQNQLRPESVKPDGDKIDGREFVGEADVGFLHPPKKPEQIQKEARYAEEAAQQKMQEEQARRGVIHPPEELHKGSERVEIGGKVAVVRQFLNRSSSMRSDDVCYAGLFMTGPDCDIEMLDVYSKLPFDDPDGGVWKQGFDITYNPEIVQHEKRLEVVVVPHSHTDPGWIKTFDEYYETQTRDILDNMLITLKSVNDMRFVYAEISFFERWWAELDEQKRRDVKQLLKLQKLEILTGGWVMTDEANSHYYGTISQLMEGHEWIRNHIGEDYKPRNYWSIDPFGLSPTVSYLMEISNFSSGVLQRVHYSVKKYLAEKKQLEFVWKQLWSGSRNGKDMITHIMPFFSYDVPHTCGPDPKICCQFDFLRTFLGGLSCPWGKPAVVITKDNVAQRAELLYDQYRKKAQLFKTNVVLVPLGDDFRYTTESEWTEQYTNYKKLFSYMNAQGKWNINARFGTLEDYFSLVRKQLQENGENLPVLSGDFFTYADRNDHYWSGYYTSRPFYKRLDRVLQNYVRTAEILHSFVQMNGYLQKVNAGKLFGLLVDARRSMSLFQHHDGITGTSKTEVMDDYGQKMFTAIKKCEQVIFAATNFLMSKKTPETIYAGSNLFMEEDRSRFDVLPKKEVVVKEGEIIIFNSLGSIRSETICVHVDSLNTIVLLAAEPNTTVPQQIGPVVEFVDNHWKISSELYELCFFSTMYPLSFQKFLFRPGTPKAKAIIRVAFAGIQSSDFDIAPLKDFVLDNGLVSATFDPSTGHLMSVSLEGGRAISVNTSFVLYRGRLKSPVPLKGSDDPPGAYLFLPTGPAEQMETKNSYIVIGGTVLQKVMIAKVGRVNLLHVIKVPFMSTALGIENTLLLNNVKNVEIAMRLITDIENGDEFFTDLNGYQMIKRRRFKQLPLQAHFYPMSASAFIEDKVSRMTLATAGPLGVASLASGQLEVMLDRRLNQDDGRGLFSGVTDNKRTTSIFRLMIEAHDQIKSSNVKSGFTAYHSLNTNERILSLLYPTVVMIAKPNGDYANGSKLINSPFPCDVHLVTLRTLAAPSVYVDHSTHIHKSQNSYAFVVHRYGVDCRFSTKIPKTCDAKLNIENLLTKRPSQITETSLTMLYDHFSNVKDVTINPMEVRTFRLDYT